MADSTISISYFCCLHFIELHNAKTTVSRTPRLPILTYMKPTRQYCAWCRVESRPLLEQRGTVTLLDPATETINIRQREKNRLFLRSHQSAAGERSLFVARVGQAKTLWRSHSLQPPKGGKAISFSFNGPAGDVAIVQLFEEFFKLENTAK